MGEPSPAGLRRSVLATVDLLRRTRLRYMIIGGIAVSVWKEVRTVERKRGLIVSLGGTPEPVVKAITTHRPEVVCFFASQQSVGQIGPVLDRAWDETHGMWQPVEKHTVLTDDPEDLVHCYEKALQCAAWIEGQRISPEEVVVDYTGGTKAMTAALTLATVGKGYRFSYVGGAARTKGGLGTVLDGAEIVRAGLDPWQLFAVEEERRFALAFNTYQFETALTVLETALRRDTLPLPKRRRFEAFKTITEGYLAWDRFDHLNASRLLPTGAKTLKTLIELTGETALAPFLAGLEQNLAFLKRLQQESKEFHVVCQAMVEDLVANAERRAKEGKYDDAVARLYRATEMVAQVRFRKPPLECGTDTVPPEKVPEPLREEFRQRYSDPTTGKLRLPLYAAYRLLQVLGVPEGEAFFAKEEAFKGLLQARNMSLLAHGATPVKAETYHRFKGLLMETFGLADLPAFPVLAG